MSPYSNVIASQAKNTIITQRSKRIYPWAVLIVHKTRFAKSSLEARRDKREGVVRVGWPINRAKRLISRLDRERPSVIKPEIT